MRKVIIGLSGIIMAAFVVTMIATAQDSSQEVKKAATEMSKDTSKCHSDTTCVKKCDPAKSKEGKCDHAKCKAKCPKATGEMKKCCHSMGKETAQK